MDKKKLNIKTNGSMDFKFKATKLADVNSYNSTPEIDANANADNTFKGNLKKPSQNVSQPVAEMK